MSARPWKVHASEQCSDCGYDLAYQPRAGWDPATDDGDNDGWTEDGERQEWRTDLVQDGDPAVCLSPTCRAQGSWYCDEGGAVASFPRTPNPMDEAAHAALVAEVSR